MLQLVIPLASIVLAALSGWLAAKLSGLPISNGWRQCLVVFSPLLNVALLWVGAAPLLCMAIAGGVSFAASALILDWHDGSIADGQSLGIAVFGLVAAPLLHPHATWMIVLGGAGLAAAVLALANLVVLARTRRSGLGSGDYGLAAAGGLWCGLGAVGPALLVAVVITVLLKLLGKGDNKGRLPFAPGLVVGFTGASIAGSLT